jgi:putative phosphonate catabolism associated alcohol dehydrogenase
MSTSRVAIFHGRGLPFTFEQVAIPSLDSGQILVRNEYTTLCRSDLNTYCGKRQEKTPTILGHEIVGRIEAFGPDVPRTDCRGSELGVGDRVTWAIYASNPDSPYSRKGIPQKAEDLFKYGHETVSPGSHLHGGLSEFCILRKHTPVIKISEEIPLPVAALINCSGATVAGSLRLADGCGGKTVLISGAGMLGVFACAMARARGAAQIIAVDIDNARLECARRFGADKVLNLNARAETLVESLQALPGAGHPDLAIDFSGVPDTMEAAVEALDIGGMAIFIGATFPQRDLSINAEQVVRRIQVIKGLHNYNADDLVDAVNFIEANHANFPFLSLIHDSFPLGSANEAFAYGMSSNIHRVGINLSKHD